LKLKLKVEGCEQVGYAEGDLAKATLANLLRARRSHSQRPERL